MEFETSKPIEREEEEYEDDDEEEGMSSSSYDDIMFEGRYEKVRSSLDMSNWG